MTKKYYVTMTDKFLSGWGGAAGRTSKFVVECESIEQAREIARNARKSPEMKYINIAHNKPSYPARSYHTEIKVYSECTAFHD